MSQYRVNEYRIYEGEWRFHCINATCLNGTLIEYSLNKYEDYADYFLDGKSGPIHTNAWCENCNSSLEWAGYSGNSPISDNLVSLLENHHFMAATVILSAIIENSISNFLWSALVDNGMSYEKANNLADGRLGRIDSIHMLSSLTGFKIKDISFKSRNLVAHGKGFFLSEEEYQKDLSEQAEKILIWTEDIHEKIKPNRFNPTECERWILFMHHWSKWLIIYIKNNFLR